VSCNIPGYCSITLRQVTWVLPASQTWQVLQIPEILTFIPFIVQKCWSGNTKITLQIAPLPKVQNTSALKDEGKFIISIFHLLILADECRNDEACGGVKGEENLRMLLPYWNERIVGEQHRMCNHLDSSVHDQSSIDHLRMDSIRPDCDQLSSMFQRQSNC